MKVGFDRSLLNMKCAPSEIMTRLILALITGGDFRFRQQRAGFA
jgi:hypothetical protein